MANAQLLDNQFLEDIKRTVLYNFRKQGYGSSQLSEISERAEGYKIYLVQDLGVLMKCNPKAKLIYVDSSFANVDENGKFVSWKAGMAKLIQSQIGHELIHAFSYMQSDGYTGMKRSGNVDYVAMNEGVTQMITEESFGYVVSPLSDGYKHFKKFAKILQATFGSDNSIYDDFLFHTNKLRDKCNRLVGDNNFYDMFNSRMSIICNMSKDDNLRAAKDISCDLLYEELVCKIVIPQLKQMPENNRKTYISEIMKSVEDDVTVSIRIDALIEKYLQLDSQKYQQEVNSLEKKLSDQDRVNQNLNQITFGKSSISDLFGVATTATGKVVLFTKQLPQIIVENDELKETILAQTLQKEMGGKDSDEFNNFKNQIKDNLFNDKDKTISLDCSDVDTARKKLCAIKKIAKKNGYTILEDLSDVTPNEIIQIEPIKSPQESKQCLSFADLKKIVTHLSIQQDENNYKDMVAVNRKTRAKIQDPKLSYMAKFGAMWLSAAGSKYLREEEIHGITYAFNDGSERVFNDIMEIAQQNLRETGTIDAEYIIEKIEADNEADTDYDKEESDNREKYKHAGKIVRKLFDNEWKRNVFVGFVSSITPDSLMETENSRNKYGINLTDYHASQVEDLVEGM